MLATFLQESEAQVKLSISVLHFRARFRALAVIRCTR